MTMSAITTDHVDELLILVIRFTRARRVVLIDNLLHMDVDGFVPKDLAVLEFSEQLHVAISEHISHRRLILRDKPHVRFGRLGRLYLLPQTDQLAKGLLESDIRAYIQYQMHRFLENTLNEEVALKMLRIYAGPDVHRSAPGTVSVRPLTRADLTDSRTYL